MKLVEGLKLIQSQVTSESLTAYDNFEFVKLYRFKQIYQLEVEDTITGVEPFPDKILSSKKINVSLLDNIYNILIEYYNIAYNLEFLFIVRSVQKATRHSDHIIVVQLQINQFRCIRIGAKVFRSANTPQYSKNLFILAKFVQENDSIEIFPGQVQYFFEHEIKLPEGKQSHRLAYIRWFISASDH